MLDLLEILETKFKFIY